MKNEIESRKACADAYIAEGFYVFPLFNYTDNNGKHHKKAPKVPWTTPPADINQDASELPEIYGVRLTDEILVIDADPRRYIDNKDELRLFLAMCGTSLNQLDTFIVKTGGAHIKGCQGYHVYLKKPEGLRLRHTLREFPGIEIKTLGQYVVGAGSIHPDTKSKYSIVKGWIGELQNAPKKMLSILEKTYTATPGGNEGYDDSESNQRRFASFLKAALPAIEGQGGNNQTFSVACEGRDYGLSPSLILSYMLERYNPKCEPEWEEDELADIVEHAFAYGQNSQGALNQDDFKGVESSTDVNLHLGREKWIRNGKEFLATTLGNTVSLLRAAPCPKISNPFYRLFQFNEFSRRIEFTRQAEWHGTYRKEIEDADLSYVLHWYSLNLHYNCSLDTMARSILIAAKDNSVHPLKFWLNTLKWDRKPRLDTFLTKYAGVHDTPYVREVGKNTMIGAVARALNPGCQMDTMLILEGDQGNSKTSFVRILGGEFYADVSLDPKAKDTIQKMSGAWILEASEMEFISRLELNSVKSFLTITTDKIRLPWDRLTSIIKRSSIFIGTANPQASGAYLNDTTGNRRFWPVKTNKIDLKGLQRDRDQLFAEAVCRFNKGENYHIADKMLLAEAKAEQKKREHQDEWKNAITKWLMSPSSSLRFTIADMSYEALNLMPKDLGKLQRNRIADILRELGYTQCSWRTKGWLQHGWKEDASDI